MALEILKSMIDHNSGHVTCQVRVKEVDDAGRVSYGPMEVVGIAHQSLTTAHGCPVNATTDEVARAVSRWLGQHHAKALARKRSLDQRGAVVAGLAGQVLEFEDAGAGAGEPAPMPALAPAAAPEPSEAQL